MNLIVIDILFVRHPFSSVIRYYVIEYETIIVSYHNTIVCILAMQSHGAIVIKVIREKVSFIEGRFNTVIKHIPYNVYNIVRQ